MKRSLLIVFSLALALSLALPAFATAGEGETASEPETTVETVTVVPDVNVYNEVVVDNGEESIVSADTTVFSLNPVTSSDATGLKAVLLEFLGDWDSIVVEHSYTTTSGNTSYVREIQLDYPWLCSAGLLAIFIFCLFRLGGSILCKK